MASFVDHIFCDHSSKSSQTSCGLISYQWFSILDFLQAPVFHPLEKVDEQHLHGLCHYQFLFSHLSFSLCQKYLYLGTFLLFLLFVVIIGEQGWCSGEGTRLPPIWPRFDSRTQRHKWVQFVGSLQCSEGFCPVTLVFPIPQKPTFDLIVVDFIQTSQLVECLLSW